MNSAEFDEWLDISGLMPPIPIETAKSLNEVLKKNPLNITSGKHTFLPTLITRNQFENIILPALKLEFPADYVSFIENRVSKTFQIRHKLKFLEKQIINIVGEGNFSALWLDREALSADSMEHRALMTESVVYIYSAQALQKIVTLFYKNEIPMIPYGEGGGYNMGVTPMTPGVTISLRGIDHISEIKKSRRSQEKYEISVGAGVPFKDLVNYLNKRGYILRCDPNTPRAATGGIAATGSNGGRKAFEVIVHGRAVASDGSAFCIAADNKETECIQNEPFLLARKFFSIEEPQSLKKVFQEIKEKKLTACVTQNSHGIVIPLQGFKAEANMRAQQFEFQKQNSLLEEAMLKAPTVPISAFVGAEGTTGFLYEVTFEIEKPKEWLKAARWHFNNTEAAMLAISALKKFSKEKQPEYFEYISGHSIKRYLIQDFPSVFSLSDKAVIIFSVEENSEEECELTYAFFEKLAEEKLKEAGFEFSTVITKIDKTKTVLQSRGLEEFELLRKPRETLPKKLRTKCKTDMEIRSEYLSDVLKLIDHTKPKNMLESKQDVLFGHLTPNLTAIIHWNIGGFDLYDEEQADIAWDYLEEVIGTAQNLAPKSDKHKSASFSGEHGIAGKAPFLWLNYLDPNEFARMCAIKDIFDPKDLFNTDKIFLKTSHARSLRARLLNTSARFIKDLLLNTKQVNSSPKVMNSNSAIRIDETTQAGMFAIEEGQKCTRCNSCKICPVIDAEHELEREGKRNSPYSVLPSKRNILMFMEKMAHIRLSALQNDNKKAYETILNKTSEAFEKSKNLLKKCFYCRRCDTACPVDIKIHPLMSAYHTMGKLPSMGSKMWGFIYDRLMGEDKFKAYTFRFLAFSNIFIMPILFLLRQVKLIPDWLKTYTVLPKFTFVHYEACREGVKINSEDNFVIISNDSDNNLDHKKFIANDHDTKQTVYIRYRGCMDTFSNPNATLSVDQYFKEHLNVRLVDLEKKLCCGFPYEAEGLHEKARQIQMTSLVEITKCIAKLISENAKISPNSDIPTFILFSNCPTCCEAIKEMHGLLDDKELAEKIRIRAKLPTDFNMSLIKFEVKDTTEIALAVLNTVTHSNQKINKKVGLKVPCHNTPLATAAQLLLLKEYFTEVVSYDKCCGLSGTGRLKNPKIGTKISEKLFEQIREEVPVAVLSGCPSCRDGVNIQKNILLAKNDDMAKFEINGIFEYIMMNLPKQTGEHNV